MSAHGIFLSENEGSNAHEGMVMELLGNAEALGQVPSFTTVTRDAGPSDGAKDMSKEQVLSVVWNVATALEQRFDINGICCICPKLGIRALSSSLCLYAAKFCGAWNSKSNIAVSTFTPCSNR